MTAKTLKRSERKPTPPLNYETLFMASRLTQRRVQGATKYQVDNEHIPVHVFPLRLHNRHNQLNLRGSLRMRASKQWQIKFSTMDSIRTIEPYFCLLVFRKPGVISFGGSLRPFCALQFALSHMNKNHATLSYSSNRVTNHVCDMSVYATLSTEGCRKIRTAGMGEARPRFPGVICPSPYTNTKAGATIYKTSPITAYGHSSIFETVGEGARMHGILHSVRRYMTPIDSSTASVRRNYKRSRAEGNTGMFNGIVTEKADA